MTTAQVDKKGRLTLGRRFAGKTVIVTEIDNSTVKITAAVVIPEREAWLYKNKSALSSVQRGLNQARKRQFVKGPNLAADAKLVQRLDD
ncbi:MAG TPA: hypothetical protein VMG59_04180 [Phycisphaerae bacterium]|nr:hypothetical protein [Phycisphaerae bacterium]